MTWNTTTSAPTNSTEVVYNLPFTKWIVFEVFSVILITLSCYMFVVLIRFNCSKRKRRKSTTKTPSTWADYEATINTSNGNVRQSGINFYNADKKRRIGRTGKSANSLRVLCLCASFFAVIRISADQLELGTYGGERINCRIYQVGWTTAVVAKLQITQQEPREVERFWVCFAKRLLVYQNIISARL